MPSLKDLRNRINSVKSTQKITKAMQMVAASKLRRAQDSVEAARPYSQRMERMLGSLAVSVRDQMGASALLVGSGRDETHLLVVATAERECGHTGHIVPLRDELAVVVEDLNTLVFPIGDVDKAILVQIPDRRLQRHPARTNRRHDSDMPATQKAFHLRIW